jgi:hypothetical protein
MDNPLLPTKSEDLLRILQARFHQNMIRHSNVEWADVLARLEADTATLSALHQMEQTGGEPDVVGGVVPSGGYQFIDCSAQTPKGRVSVCYDRAGLDSRKEHKPQTSAVEMAEAMGIALLTEEQYLMLQTLGEFDTKTSSWVKTGADVRKLGGALYGERRYGRVFIGHNGAQSYYSVRGFRGWVSA